MVKVLQVTILWIAIVLLTLLAFWQRGEPHMKAFLDWISQAGVIGLVSLLLIAGTTWTIWILRQPKAMGMPVLFRRLSLKYARDGAYWRKYRPLLTTNPVLRANNVHFFVNPTTNKIDKCRIYLDLHMEARFPFGYTILDVANSEIVVMQKRGMTRRHYRFMVSDGTKHQPQANVARGQSWSFSAEYVCYDDGENEAAYIGPNLDHDFTWELHGQRVLLEGPQRMMKTLPPLRGNRIGTQVN